MSQMELLRDFAEVMLKARGPADAALFSRGTPAPEGLRAEVFFSPTAARIATSLILKFKTTRCPHPSLPKAGDAPADPVGALAILAGSRPTCKLLA